MMRNSKWCAAALLLVACGDGTQRSGAPETALEQGDVAGGETSEFSGGDIAYCPEVGATFTALDLDAPGVAPWAAMAEGQHELPLRWYPQFASDAISGYEEHTGVVLDVHVASARDVVFGEANLGYEGEGCKGSGQRQLELAVDLRTADGALAGSFRHWVSPVTNRDLPGTPYLVSTSKADNFTYPLSDFTTGLALEIDVGDASEQARELLVLLMFYADGLRGDLGVRLTTTGVQGTRFVDAIGAAFPDDGCELALPVALDERTSRLADTPRTAYERMRAELERAPIPALWQEAFDPPQPGRATEVTLSAGEPTHACETSQGIYVHAPLTVRSVDGLIDYTQAIATRLYPLSGGAMGGDGHGRMPMITAASFADTPGLTLFELGESAYGRALLRSTADANGAREGTLSATTWIDGEERGAEPTLAWCDGPECERFWCLLVYQTSDCEWP